MTTNNEPLDPNDYERVSAGCQCPQCGEDDIDHLVWLDDEKVRCTSCGTVYDPNQPDAEA
jgi:rubredoxin